MFSKIMWIKKHFCLLWIADTFPTFLTSGLLIVILNRPVENKEIKPINVKESIKYMYVATNYTA